MPLSTDGFNPGSSGRNHGVTLNVSARNPATRAIDGKKSSGNVEIVRRPGFRGRREAVRLSIYNVIGYRLGRRPAGRSVGRSASIGHRVLVDGGGGGTDVSALRRVGATSDHR